MSYKSPIDSVVKGFKTAFEDGVFKGVLDMGISIDKDELIRCLNYDRGQYDIGFQDGYFTKESSIVRCRNCKHWGDEAYGYVCNAWSGINTKNYTKPDEFCSRGERKEQG